MSQTADVIVWGLGGMGSAVAWRLARAGARVLGFDQFGPVHDRGSSHGETRIIRKAYFEHPHYVPLLQRAYQLWAELEAETQRTLFLRSGLFIAGGPECEAVRGTRQAAADHGLPLERLTPAEARREFPAFRFEDRDEVVFEADAGYLLVEVPRLGVDPGSHAQWPTGGRAVFERPETARSLDVAPLCARDPGTLC